MKEIDSDRLRQHQYKHVFFKPWIGRNYGSDSIFGMPILVVGESHFQWDENIPMTPETTISCIEDGEKHPFRRKVASVVLGHEPLAAERGEFWHSVSFYNFVQQNVGFGAKNRPTPQMFSDSIPAFMELVSVFVAASYVPGNVLRQGVQRFRPTDQTW